PFSWQLDAALAVLQSKDVIIDVGTGSKKSLCFILPLLLNEHDTTLVIIPLSALMIDQVHSMKLLSVAICRQTLAMTNTETVYKDIVSGKHHMAFISPEIAKTPEFHSAVLSKAAYHHHLWVVGIDEAHCISLWSGSFRPDY
ncbi:hypothetical protein BKA93DRAFT_707357, partial [Sparassis latifolia]